ncbi:hypothetical protein [Rudaeicoccus suwonensis]|uniref:Uncharacterized protein n=1 Tax=Rudaeicoccus suwonensis TaxID=657409 RepID=A0A561ECT7_9MICO|nr:hypothetical protein [Rudaeicoccus suwonensis]TWE13424.1 hypothetical protein BKA23_2254 [Rudaeicoccus suwonensis]
MTGPELTTVQREGPAMNFVRTIPTWFAAALSRRHRPYRVHRDRRYCYLVAAAMVLAVCACAVVAGHAGGFAVFFTVLAVACVGVQQWGPGMAGALTLSAAAWFSAAPPSQTPWCVPAAVAMLVMFSAMTLAGYGPEAAPVPRDLLLRWVRRVAVVAAITVVAGLLAGAMGSAGMRGSVDLSAVGLLLVAGLVVVIVRIITAAHGSD